MDTAEDKTALGTFPYNTKVNAVIVEDDNAIRTAWIWEVEEGDNDIDDNNPIATEVTKIDADNFKIYLNAFVGADNRVAVITRAMEKGRLHRRDLCICCEQRVHCDRPGEVQQRHQHELDLHHCHPLVQ